jgi:hypothetical protein
VQFASLRLALAAEREAILKRLQQIDSALAGRVDTAPVSPKKPVASRTRSKRPQNQLNIRESITKVTQSKALSIAEIVAAVQKVGYKFATSNPQNSVGAFLYGYGKKYFKRAKGKFSPK